MKRYAIVFPGQGSQTSGMGKDLYESSTAARRVFEVADEVSGKNISELCFEGSDADLMQTINSQPCILTVSIAAYEALKEKTGIEASAFAGHSLGEYAALYAAGVVDLKTVILLIKKRAELMNAAAEKTSGTMAAVLGLDNETVINLTKTMSNVYVANFNSPGQVVITGDKEEISSNLDKFKEAGAKRVIPLSVSGAFHSPLMSSAEKEFEEYVKEFTFNDSRVPVYTNVDAKRETSGKEFCNKLPKQITSSVLWTQTINNIMSEGINEFIEIGPGRVLAGLNKKISAQSMTYNVYDADSLNNTINEINKERELV